LIVAYKGSSDFPTNEKTASEYRRYLKLIEEEFGSMSITVVEDKRARGKFKAWRDTMADRPRTADYAWTVLARALSFAEDRGLITVNVCKRGGRLYEADRSEIIWTAEHIRRFCDVASDPLKFALVLALWTGQRQTDLIRLTSMQYDGTRIRLRQRKGRKRVVIPVGEPLKAMLDAYRRDSPMAPSCAAPMAKRGLGMASGRPGARRSSVPVSPMTTCIFTTFAAPRSPAWRSPAARSRRSRRSPVTASKTWSRSLRRTTWSARSNSPNRPSSSSTPSTERAARQAREVNKIAK
jgi:integrase